MTRPRIPPVGSHVKVYWADSDYQAGWCELNGAQLAGDIRLVTTYGRIIERNAKGIVIGSTVVTDRETGEVVGVLNPLFIPRGAIEGFTLLDED